MYQIFTLIDEGYYPAKISRILGISKQLLNYWLKRLVRLGYLEKGVRTSVVFYHLTDLGKEMLLMLSESKKTLTGCEAGPRVRLHNVSFKFRIIKDADIPIDWRKVEMQNWGRLIGSVYDVTVEKTTKHLIVYPKIRTERDPYVALLKAYEEAIRVAKSIENRFGLILGLPELNRKPHFGFKDPIADKLSEYQETTLSDIGRIDQSPGEGEIEFFDPSTAADYIAMPNRVKRIEEKINKLEETLERISNSLERVSAMLEKLVQVQVAFVERLSFPAGKINDSHIDYVR